VAAGAQGVVGGDVADVADVAAPEDAVAGCVADKLDHRQPVEQKDVRAGKGITLRTSWKARRRRDAFPALYRVPRAYILLSSRKGKP
jgi:hypothetical protein